MGMQRVQTYYMFPVHLYAQHIPICIYGHIKGKLNFALALLLWSPEPTCFCIPVMILTTTFYAVIHVVCI